MMLLRHDVVCISSIDWDFIWQGHQQIMSTLAAQGHRVLFIENTGVRPPRLGDFSRVRHRIARWWSSTQGFRRERPNLYVFSPLVLPFPYSRLARWLNRLMLLRAIRRWMRVMDFGRPIVWTFLPTPLARDLLRDLDPQLTVYYCIDDLASSSVQARRIRKTEAQVFADVDLVFVTSVKLRERAERFTPRVHLFPFAVDYAKFEAARTGPTEPPPDLTALTRPIVGYVGGVHQWVDQALLADVARRMPDATFALVGPLQTGVDALRDRPNVHLLGARPHAAVPSYLKGFDVGIVPYRLSEYTAHVYPTKLNEYLAMGLPVVATDLPEIRRFNADHGEIVRVAADAERFVDEIREALAKRSADEEARRIEVARQNGWEARIERMQALIEERVQRRHAVEGSGWEETLRRVYGVARRRLAGAAGMLGIAYVALFLSPLPWIAAAPLRLAATPTAADAIVVFGGGTGESGVGGQGYEPRVDHAVTLYEAGRASQIVFSSGWTYSFQEAEAMRALAMSRGVPAGSIVLETRAANTRENVLFTRTLLEQRGWRRVLLVSSPYHMRRAVLAYRKAAPELQVLPVPFDSPFYAHGWGADLSQLRGILKEYAALAYYWWKDWI